MTTTEKKETGKAAFTPKSESTTNTEEARIAGLPAQFNTVEDLAKSYNTIRAKMDGKKDNDDESSEVDTSTDTGTDSGVDSADDSGKTGDDTIEVTGDGGLKPFDKFTQEFTDSGELSEASYAELDKLGYPKDVVDDHIEGRLAVAEQQYAKLMEVFSGSEEALAAAMHWGARNLSEEERKVHDSALQGAPAQRRAAMELLRHRYQAATGVEGSLFVAGGGSETTSTRLDFKNQTEISEAMADPRYATDSKYREAVTEGIKRGLKR